MAELFKVRCGSCDSYRWCGRQCAKAPKGEAVNTVNADPVNAKPVNKARVNTVTVNTVNTPDVNIQELVNTAVNIAVNALRDEWRAEFDAFRQSVNRAPDEPVKPPRLPKPAKANGRPPGYHAEYMRNRRAAQGNSTPPDTETATPDEIV